MERKQVYQLIDSERDYQNSKPPRPKSDSETSVAEWLLYMDYHLSKAKGQTYWLLNDDALESIRKIAALAVACMENNETKSR